MEPTESLITRFLALQALSKTPITFLGYLEILRLLGLSEEELTRLENWHERGDLQSSS